MDELEQAMNELPTRRLAMEGLPEPLRTFALAFQDEQAAELRAMLNASKP